MTRTEQWKPEAVIVCGRADQARCEMWVSVLTEAAASCIAVIEDNDLGFAVLPGQPTTRPVLRWKNIEAPVPVVLIHQGDSGLWDDQVKANKVFWFDTPGSPAGRKGDWNILRSTAASSFDITGKDAKEIIDFGLGNRQDPPACCQPKPVLSHLPAFAILCQGYLAVYAKEHPDLDPGDIRKAVEAMGWNPEKHGQLVKEGLNDVVNPSWWLRVFDVSEEMDETGHPKVSREHWERFTIGLEAEWGPQPLPNALKGLMDRLLHLQPIDSAGLVSQAYLAIAKRLGDA